MTLNPTNRTDLVQLELEKARRTWKEAEGNFNIQLWNVVGNRIYYALFHAVVALLIKNGISINGHKGAVIMFGKHFVKTGIFTPEEGSLYSRLQTIREQADYQNVYELSPEKATHYMTLAKALFEKIEDVILNDNV